MITILFLNLFNYLMSWHIYMTYILLLISVIIMFNFYEKLILGFYLCFITLFWFNTDLTLAYIFDTFASINLIGIHEGLTSGFYTACDMIENSLHLLYFL